MRKIAFSHFKREMIKIVLLIAIVSTITAFGIACEPMNSAANGKLAAQWNMLAADSEEALQKFDKTLYEEAMAFIASSEVYNKECLDAFLNSDASILVHDDAKLAMLTAAKDNDHAASTEDEAGEEIGEADEILAASPFDDQYPIYDTYGHIVDHGTYEQYKEAYEAYAKAPEIVVLRANFYKSHIVALINDKRFGAYNVVFILNNDGMIKEIVPVA